MNVFGVIPNFIEAANIKSANKSTNTFQNYNGPSFSESMTEIARSANIQIAGENSAASLAFSRQKEEILEEPFSFLETEEEILENSIAKIMKLFDQLKK